MEYTFTKTNVHPQIFHSIVLSIPTIHQMMMLAETKEEAVFRAQKPPKTSEWSIQRKSNGNDKLKIDQIYDLKI
jgi:hypothetical protein